MLSSLPREVRPILAALLPGIQAALGDNCVGVYLRGSLATGDFISTSDLDFLVATGRVASDAEFSALSELHTYLGSLPDPYALLLEGAYLDRASLQRFARGQRHPTLYADSAVLSFHEHRDNWVLERWVVRERGITLSGPDPKDLIDPISSDDLRQAVHSRLSDWKDWASHPDDPQWLLVRSHQAYVIETMCRVLYTLAHGELSSKARAGAWALEALPDPWRGVVERARASRASAEPAPANVPEVLRFVQWAASDGVRVFG